MFNLDESISEWRRQMLAAGIKTPVPLNELENHLRDDVEQQMRSGLSAQQAFEAAVQGIGHPALEHRTWMGDLPQSNGLPRARCFSLGSFGCVCHAKASTDLQQCSRCWR